MRIKCIAVEPTTEQAARLGNRYRPGQQIFPVSIGDEHLVFGIEADRGSIWVFIEHEFGYLVSVPLVLFQTVDGRLPPQWEARSDSSGDLRIAPSELLQDCFFDDLSEGVPDTLRVFRALKHELIDADAKGSTLS